MTIKPAQYQTDLRYISAKKNAFWSLKLFKFLKIELQFQYIEAKYSESAETISS